MNLKYQRGYIDPSPFDDKKLGNLSARVPLQVMEDIEAFAKEHRLKRAEVVRMCIEKTLYCDDNGNIALRSPVASTNSKKSVHHKNESTSIRTLVIRIANSFLQTQKKPEFAAQALNAQHPKGH